MFKSWLTQKWNNVKDFTNRDVTSLGRKFDFQRITPLDVILPWHLLTYVKHDNFLYTSPYKDGQAVEMKLADPNQHSVLFNSSGRRMVYARGYWQEDDPSNRVNNFMYQTTFTKGQGFSRASNNPYLFMDAQGNYLDDSGKVIPQGTHQWLLARYGSNPPPDVFSNWEQQNASSISPVSNPNEQDLLDWIYNKQQSYRSQGLVQIGKPVQQGAVFYINGQRAIMGTPEPNGKWQYARTLPGEGDRWKFKTEQDSEGNWVRVYYRTFGAGKERQMRRDAKRKAKGKE